MHQDFRDDGVKEKMHRREEADNEILAILFRGIPVHEN